jgi:hypothetical protein
MEFSEIEIKNFRNFENIKINLKNKNIFFGLNDVGKTNFLYAFRYILDKNIRKLNLQDSDFYQKNLEVPIEITLKINLGKENNSDTQKLRAKIKGNILSTDKAVYIKLIAQYDKNEMIAIPKLYWGGNIENLKEMNMKNYFYEIDNVVNLFYIDSYIDLYTLFKKNINKLIRNNQEENDNEKIKTIDSLLNELNSKISSLSGVKGFEEKITPEFSKFKNEKELSISIKSEIAIKGLYSNMIPYIKYENEDQLYPTSGEGRKKLLGYTIYDILADDSKDEKINIFLIEEPENHLHKSLQIMLSKLLFTEEKYNYLFLTTHSPYILYDMDDINLVRIYNDNKINSKSMFYKIPKEYKNKKELLNKDISEAIFMDRVLLVEGISELKLFQRILSEIKPYYEIKGGYVLLVKGTGFEMYYDILKGLSIKVIIKTDNDLRKNTKGDGKFSVLGFNRVNKYSQKNNSILKLPINRINENSVESKKNLYNENKELLDKIQKESSIYLSKVDLENDLDEVIHNKLVEYLECEDPVEYLQKSKDFNMVELIEKLTEKDCKLIYEHSNFSCLKEV